MRLLQTSRGKITLAVVLAVTLWLGGAAWWQLHARAATAVLVEVAALSNVTRVLAVNGTIAAMTSVVIRAPLTGTILRVAVQEGDLVARGAVLATLDPAVQIASVIQAQAALAQGRMRAVQTTESFAREAKLGQLISSMALEESRQLAALASQEVLRLDALLAQATLQLARFSLKAPMRGTIMTATADVGQLVDPSAGLFTLADLSALVVKASVDETYANDIKLGQIVMLQMIGTPAVLGGRVAFVAPRIDAATGGLAVNLAFDAPVSAPTGLTVTANIVIDQRKALTVPRSALQRGGVFLVQNGTAHWMAVTTIDWPADRLIVTRGLMVGDVVIQTANGIAEGQRVTASDGAD